MAKELESQTVTPVTPAEEPKPSPPQATVPAGTYVGPKPAPLISNLPDDVNKYRADQLPDRHRAFVIATVPAAKGWWK